MEACDKDAGNTEMLSVLKCGERRGITMNVGIFCKVPEPLCILCFSYSSPTFPELLHCEAVRLLVEGHFQEMQDTRSFVGIVGSKWIRRCCFFNLGFMMVHV